MTRHKSMVPALLVAACFAAVAVADDLNPPPWRKNGQRVITAVWDFNNDDNPAQPEPFTYNGDGQSDLYDRTLHEARMSSGLTHQNGSWHNNHDDNADITFLLTNFINDNPGKRMRIQITYAGAGIPTISHIYGNDDNENVAIRSSFEQFTNYRYEDWTFDNNPYKEEFFLLVPGRTSVSQVIIDTQCIPAPATAFLGITALCLCAPRRRR